MPQFLKLILEGALSGLGSALGTAFLGILLVALHVVLPFLIPVTIIALALWVKFKLITPKAKLLPPSKFD
jgi:hypothetical protein